MHRRTSHAAEHLCDWAEHRCPRPRTQRQRTAALRGCADFQGAAVRWQCEADPSRYSAKRGEPSPGADVERCERTTVLAPVRIGWSMRLMCVRMPLMARRVMRVRVRMRMRLMRMRVRMMRVQLALLRSHVSSLRPTRTPWQRLRRLRRRRLRVRKAAQAQHSSEQLKIVSRLQRH